MVAYKPVSKCGQAGTYLLDWIHIRVYVVLFIKSRISGIVGIGIAILFLLLGWLGVFAQSQSDFPPPRDFIDPGGFSDPGGFPGPRGFSGPRGGRGRRGFSSSMDFPLTYDDPSNIDPPYPSGDWEFVFARMVYTGIVSRQYIPSWTTDWPKSDRQFVLGIKRLTNIRVAEETVAVSLTNPDLYKYPFIYSVECGYWSLTDDEIKGLREYLKRGGFLFCDDFWGTYEWEIFRENILKVLPEGRISDIPLSHHIFHCYYDIEELVQVPYIMQALYSTQTYEQDGYFPYCRGIFDENDRLMVMINWNTDLGDAWEHADHPDLPTRYSTYAYKIGINAIVYAMSH